MKIYVIRIIYFDRVSKIIINSTCNKEHHTKKNVIEPKGTGTYIPDSIISSLILPKNELHFRIMQQYGHCLNFPRCIKRL